MPDPERGYRWGRFQGWSSLVIGVLFILAGPWVSAEFRLRLATYTTGTTTVFLGIGLLGKKRYGFVLFYVVLALVGLETIIAPHWHPEAYVMAVCWWLIPAVFYYPKRYREFGRKAETVMPERMPVGNVRQRVGRIASSLGVVCYFVFGIVGFIVSLSIVSQVTGFWGFVIALALAPVTFAAAPWYALVHWGNWIPLLINYGGIISAWVFGQIGERLDQ